jgi:hypothetical protein
MFINIGEKPAEPIEGFVYTNRSGDEEFVHVGPHVGDGVDIEDSTTKKVTIFTEDIPKLIKALQAAYSHLTK